MTNEELAKQIQLGHIEFYTELWEKVHKLMCKILHSKLKRLNLPNYLAAEDLEQEMYFALCNAVQAYDSTKTYPFNSYLEYHVMNAIRSAKPNKLKYEYSYNQTFGDNEDTEFIDLIPDDTALERLTQIELTDIQKLTRQAVAELPCNEREAVTLHYFRGCTYKQIGEITNVSRYVARNRVSKGLTLLKRNKAIRGIYGEFRRHYAHTEYKHWRWQTSKDRQVVKESIAQRRMNGEYISYGTERSLLYIAKQKYMEKCVGPRW